jgi:hypothetical protein
MFEMGGRQYLLVPAASTPPRGAGAAPAPAPAAQGIAAAAAPLGWVASALPAQAN